MFRLILEKIIIFSLIFAFTFVVSFKSGQTYQDREQEFKDNIIEIMDKYNYVEDDNLTWDYRFVKDNNEVTYNVDITPKKVKISKIGITINFSNEVDLKEIYNFFNEIYSDDEVNYQTEIEKLYTNLVNNVNDENFKSLNDDRQVTLNVKKATSDEDMYELTCSINFFE